MNPSEAFVRAGILDYFGQQKPYEDHVLNLQYFCDSCMTDWTAEQKLLLEPALVNLIRDGILARQDGYIILTVRGLSVLIDRQIRSESAESDPPPPCLA
jgi:hypothetical protein